MATALATVALCGLGLSYYALMVETYKEADPEYEALCDISASMSCSKVFTSDWGHVFSKLGVFPAGHALDLPNAVYGMLFFGLVAVLMVLPVSSVPKKATFVFYLSLPVVAMCVLLGYVLAFVLHDVCVVCLTTYACNALVLYLSGRLAWGKESSSSKGSGSSTSSSSRSAKGTTIKQKAG